MGFVVEGFNDERKVKEVMPDALCVVTKGTRMNGRVKLDVEKALVECDKLFLLTDPDEAGEQLADMVLQRYPSLERVQLDREQCLCYRNHKLKVGVEHCDNDYLKKILSNYLTMLV
jgi:ribonuclease M5